jgi:hypothetical protein
MNKMKHDINELTNDGKRNLLRLLCDELSFAEISRLVQPFAKRLMLDEMREPFIVIHAPETDLGRAQVIWIDVNDVVTHTIDTDD